MKCAACGDEPGYPAEEHEYERVRDAFGDVFVCPDCVPLYEDDDRFTFPNRAGGESASGGGRA